MERLLRDLIPHAPQMGLYVVPHIPEEMIRNALLDFARGVQPNEVLALYDATLIGNARDGAVFARDRLVFQNTDLSPVQTVRYEDLVGVESKRRFLVGRKVHLSVNRGRATIQLTLDFSGKPKAAEFVARFLREAMLQPPEQIASEAAPSGTAQTDVQAVTRALEALRAEGRLAEPDYEALLRVLTASRT